MRDVFFWIYVSWILFLTVAFLYFISCLIFPNKRRHRHHPRHVSVYITIGGERVSGMQNLKVSKQYNLGIVGELDEFGNPVSVAFDAAPQWSLTDPSLGAISAAEDGMSAILIPSGHLGVCQVQSVALAGGKTLMGVADVTFIAGDAVSFGLSIAEGSDNVVPPPAG